MVVAVKKARKLLREVKEKYKDDQSRVEGFFLKQIDEKNAYMQGKRRRIFDRSEEQIFSAYIQILEELYDASQKEQNGFEAILAEYKKRANHVCENSEETGHMIDNTFIVFERSLNDERIHINSFVRIMQADKDCIPSIFFIIFGLRISGGSSLSMELK